MRLTSIELAAKRLIQSIVDSQISDQQDCEDVKQKIYCIVYEKYYTNYVEEGKFLHWVSVISINECRNYYRQKNRERILLQKYCTEFIPYEMPFPRASMRDSCIDVLDDFIDSLHNNKDEDIDFKINKSIFLDYKSKAEVAREESVSYKRTQRVFHKCKIELNKQADLLFFEEDKDSLY